MATPKRARSKPATVEPRTLVIAPDGYITAKQAAEAVKVSLPTIRSWYNAGKVASLLVESTNGPQRYVSEAEVREKAAATHPGRPRTLVRAAEWERLVAEIERRAEAEKQLSIETFKREQAERRVAELEARLARRRWLSRG